MCTVVEAFNNTNVTGKIVFLIKKNEHPQKIIIIQIKHPAQNMSKVAELYDKLDTRQKRLEMRFLRAF